MNLDAAILIAQTSPPSPTEAFTLGGATALLGLFALLAWRAWTALRDTSNDARQASAEHLGRLDADRKWWRDEAYARDDTIKARDATIQRLTNRNLQLERALRDAGLVPPSEEP